MPTRSRYSNAAFVAAFLLLLCLPGLETVVRLTGQPPGTSAPEAFDSASTPPIQFPAAFEKYFDESFGLRDWLARWNNLLRLRVLRESPVDTVLVGKDGWLFYRSEFTDDGDSLNDYAGLVPLSQAELARISHKLEAEDAEFAKRGILNIVAIAPSKHTMCERFLPYGLRRLRGVTRLDQMLAYLREHSRVQVIDLREPLRRVQQVQDARRDRRAVPSSLLYYQTDSHWTDYGAVLAYNTILERVRERFPEARPLPVDGGSVYFLDNQEGRDISQLLLLPDVVREKSELVLMLPTPPSKRAIRKVLLRADSFGDSFYRFLPHHFRKVVGLPPFAPYRFDQIDRDRPDVVIHLFAERYIPAAIFDDFSFAQRRAESAKGAGEADR